MINVIISNFFQFLGLKTWLNSRKSHFVEEFHKFEAGERINVISTAPTAPRARCAVRAWICDIHLRNFAAINTRGGRARAALENAATAAAASKPPVLNVRSRFKHRVARVDRVWWRDVTQFCFSLERWKQRTAPMPRCWRRRRRWPAPPPRMNRRYIITICVRACGCSIGAICPSICSSILTFTPVTGPCSHFGGVSTACSICTTKQLIF